MISSKFGKIAILILFLCLILTSLLLVKGQSNDSIQPQATNDVFKIEISKLRQIIANNGPQQAMNELRKDATTNNRISSICHEIAHEVGHLTYKKYNDFGKALKFQDEFCNSGYIHGVIEGYFADKEEVTDEMRSICNNYPKGKFISWQCYHGLGHGIMYFTSNDLPQSLVFCNTLASEFATSSCADGVYMENFNTDGNLHPSKYVRADSVYPCDQGFGFESSCYIYQSSYYLSNHKRDYRGALNRCLSVDLDFQGFCARGVGYQTMKENFDKPKFVESQCESSASVLKYYCIFGMVGLNISFYGEISSASKLCKSLKEENRQTCRDANKLLSVLF